MAVFGDKIREGVVRRWRPNELVLTFGGCYLCATVGENRSRNATVRVCTDRQTDRHTHRQRQTEFILYHAICYCYSYEADNDAWKTFCGWTPRPTGRAYLERLSTVINDVLTPLFPPQTYCSLLHGHTIFTDFISFLVFVMLKSMAKGA